MGQRNILCTSQMIDLGVDQQASGNVSLEAHHLPEHYDCAAFYGVMQYAGAQHYHPTANIDMGGATSSNFYNPYMTPSSGARVVPVPLNCGSSDQLPSLSNHGFVGVPTDEYGRNNHFMDGVRGSCKRKNGDSARNFPYFSASASSSSSIAPPNARHFESGASMVDSASFPLPQFRGIGNLSIMEAEPQRSVRNRSDTIGLDSVLAHNHNHYVQGNYTGLPFQPANNHWFEQQPSSSSVDGGTSTWNLTHALPYSHGSNVSRGLRESGNLGIPGYPETTSTTHFLPPPPPPIHHQHHNLHHSLGPMQGVRSHHHINIHHQIPLHSYGLPTYNASHGVVNPSQDGAEVGSRYSGPMPPTGLRIYRSSRRGAVPEATPRNREPPHLRFLPADEVAILEIPGFSEVGNIIDHHRDMRLDIDDMSYEELLALGEQIGNVKTGLSEETILNNLNTRTFLPFATCNNLEEAACMDHETDFCVICQADYRNQERIGALDCGHEYHADCLKKWLLVKNVCPICKSMALNIERKNV
ncbi:probable E3 ubiquitin-protein ligase ZFP1 isoform X2 [Malania oleifera]|uniref:probable E3 ubiquitin-protein ligase ZFP1 isoform X2 n=1 Tax=Malania oleifera TaxID=397392 RepID=UPI0025ADB600|nr:probable E3 ubiquitin-protein ligase ZFP1 isoform X2 [Malania oleifera]